MSTIQQIRAFSDQIFDIVNDYQKGDYNKNDVLAIDNNRGSLSLIADAENKIVKTKTMEVYPLVSLLRDDDNGGFEPDNDKIDEIANSWLFLD